MKTAFLFFAYAMTLFNVFVWITWPELLYNAIWKWDIFITLLFVPLIWFNLKEFKRC